MSVDLVIRNARVIDGSGTPWFKADIAIERDKIAHIGAFHGSAVTEIDAAGRVVCPGFIDVHCHSDMQLFANPDHDPKLRQGVTTDIIGVDGIGYAPLSHGNLESMSLYWGGISGSPEIALDWGSIDSFLRKLDGAASANVAVMVPHGCIRVEVLGFDDRPPSADDLERMGAIMTEGFEQGAVAFSTGLDYQPCSYSDTAELVYLAAVAERHGRPYVTHQRYKLGDGFLDPINETIEIGRKSGVQVHTSHFSASSKRVGGSAEMLALVDGARDQGVDFSFDSYPYPAGSTGLFITFPDWAHDGGPEMLLQRLSSDGDRKRLLDELREPGSPYAMWPPDILRISSVTSERKRWMEGLFLSEIVEKTGKDPDEQALDMLLEENLGISAIIMLGSEPDLQEMMRHPSQMCSTDALLVGSHPHPRGYGTYPRFLGRYVRELGILRLEDAIRRMTSAPSARFGLGDRGLLRAGYAADIVIFDPETVVDNATFDSPRQFPTGIDYVIVNGTPVIDDGAHTHARVGRALRRK